MSAEHDPGRNRRAFGERRCQARSKQQGRQCARWTRPGWQVCTVHGAKSLRGRKSPSWKTGEHSIETEARRAELVKQLTEPGALTDLVVARVGANLIEREERRAEVSDELDVTLRLHDADRRDGAVLLQAEQLRRATKTPTAPTTTINVLDAGVVCVIAVRLPNGERARAVEPRDIDGNSVGLLVEGEGGAWWPSRLVMRDGLEVAERVVNALPEGGDA
jgi:hypothetical protein